MAPYNNSNRLVFSLKWRLLISHLLVMAFSVSAIVIISRVFRTNFQDGLIAAIISVFSVITVSVLTSRIILNPLRRIEQSVRSFAGGNLAARVPDVPISEMNRLAISFNHMAASLQGVEERRRELMSDLAHELRSPITVIHGYLELINTGMAQLTPDIQAQMSQEAERLIRLVNDLLELSKIEDGHLPLQPQTIALTPILKGLVTTFTAASLQANTELQLIVPPDLPLIYADRDRVKQILINLISNAITYTPNGIVTVRSWSDVNRVWVAIEDTGIGIAEEDLPKVFDRFWRADPSRNSQTGGSGIGLAITKRLIELHNGRIEVESQLDHGSTFRFSLPKASLR